MKSLLQIHVHNRHMRTVPLYWSSLIVYCVYTPSLMQEVTTEVMMSRQSVSICSAAVLLLVLLSSAVLVVVAAALSRPSRRPRSR